MVQYMADYGSEDASFDFWLAHINPLAGQLKPSG